MLDARYRFAALVLSLASINGLILLSSVASSGCSSESIEPAPDGGADDAGPLTVETTTPNAPPLPGETECKVVKTTGISVGSAAHLVTCTPITYATNPPSGGDHWGIWAAFKEYVSPVPRESYVHAMEHGAVVLMYRCDSECPEVVKMLQEVHAEATADPLCLASAGGPPTRILLTPDPKLDTPIAAAAWGATYTATCIDKASLAQFVADRYGKGTEALCANGTDWDNPSSAPNCDGGTADAAGP